MIIKEYGFWDSIRIKKIKKILNKKGFMEREQVAKDLYLGYAKVINIHTTGNIDITLNIVSPNLGLDVDRWDRTLKPKQFLKVIDLIPENSLVSKDRIREIEFIVGVY